MKTDKHNMDLEQLLADMEHAGRDARRQQELSAMIDRMSAAERSTSRHGFWWWSARVAAAACVLFFIGTAVRVWFIPTEKGEQMVAEADIPAAIVQETIDSSMPLSDIDLRTSSHQRPTNALPTPYQRLTNSYHGSGRKVNEVSQQEPVSKIEETETPEKVYLAEVESVEDMPEIAAALPAFEQGVAVESGSVEQAEPEPVQPEQTAASTAKPRERKRSFLSSLFRPAEPSLMEGTTLALLQF